MGAVTSVLCQCHHTDDALVPGTLNIHVGCEILTLAQVSLPPGVALVFLD